MMKINCSYTKLVPLQDLKPHPKNRNKHPADQIKRLCKLIEHHGIRHPIIVSNLSGCIVAGHGRLAALTKLGYKEAPVDFQDFKDAEEEYTFLQSDNAVALWAELDQLAIIDDMKDMQAFDLELLGFKDFQLPNNIEPQCDEDEVPEVKESRTVLGDIYELGSHRVMCGDSTMIDQVDKLMNGSIADICFTSPPYNVGKTPNGNDKKYLNDADNRSSEDYRNFLKEFTLNYLTVSSFVFSNIQSLSGNKTALIDYLYDLKDNYADTIIWDKESAEPAMAKNCMNSQYEYIHVFSHKANRIIGCKEFRGTISNVFKFKSRKDKDYSSIHKATFPVGFVEYFINTFSNLSIVDPFLGSGSTLIACEKTGRKCYGMELDPHYCDVIVSRYVKYTGNKNIKLNGKEITWDA